MPHLFSARDGWLGGVAPTGVPFMLNRDHFLAKGLLGWWPVYGSCNETILRDYSIHESHGEYYVGTRALVGASSPLTVAYDLGNDCTFQVDRTNHLENLTNELTVSAWCQTDVLAYIHLLLRKHCYATSDYSFLLRQSATMWEFYVYNSGGSALADVAVGAAGPWVHLVGRFIGGTEIALWKDGAKVDSAVPGFSSITNGTNNLSLFGRQSGDWFWDGRVAEVCIWDRALSDDEINYHYENPFALVKPLVSFLPFSAYAPMAASMERGIMRGVGRGIGRGL